VRVEECLVRGGDACFDVKPSSVEAEEFRLWRQRGREVGASPAAPCIHHFTIESADGLRVGCRESRRLNSLRHIGDLGEP